MAMTPATEIKRRELLAFIERVLEPEVAVKAVIGIGSIANGLMRPDSDIDAILFLNPMDWYIVPAEFIWHPVEGTFHSIFTEDEHVNKEGIAFDFRRLELGLWSDIRFHWPEGRRAELAAGWIAFDRTGEVTDLIARRTAFPEIVRQKRLDEAVTWLDQHLGNDGPKKRWDSLGPPLAHDRLQAAYHYLVRALFAANRRWLPWRNRQMETLLQLPWLPEKFAERVVQAAQAPGLDYESYQSRVDALRSLMDDLLTHLIAEGIYTADPVDQAFIRAHDEPGYAWNMDDWNAERLRRTLSALRGNEP